MFAIECLNGKDIHNHSYFSKEDEILLLLTAHFNVVSSLNQGDPHIIHLKEFQPRFPLLQPIETSLGKSK